MDFDLSLFFHNLLKISNVQELLKLIASLANSHIEIAKLL
jgi:hypothetical protein